MMLGTTNTEIYYKSSVKPQYILLKILSVQLGNTFWQLVHDVP
jgi:hypothetical protein